MKPEFRDYLNDISQAMARALDFVKGMKYEDFAQDQKTTYAVIRAIEVIGEAVRHIPSQVKARYPKIPWKEMAGMRDKLIHEYFGVDLKRV